MRHIINETLINCNDSYEAESIEEKMRKVLANQEPIEQAAPNIYTERKEGVLPAYDIRTDRFEIAIDAADRITAAVEAKRQERAEQANVTEQPKTE